MTETLGQKSVVKGLATLDAARQWDDSPVSVRLAVAMSRLTLKASAHPISGVLNCPADTLLLMALCGPGM